ncbi:MAG: hypothetical protein ACI8XD_001938 [Thermoproteota archaeon]|jgi:hypothetical protein
MQVDRYRAKPTRAVAVTLSVISARVLQWFRQLYCSSNGARRKALTPAARLLSHCPLESFGKVLGAQRIGDGSVL